MILTSHSSRSTFKSCKRKYHYIYVRGLEPEHKSKALRMGTGWSIALEHGPQAMTDYYGELMMKCAEWDLSSIEHELKILEALESTYPYRYNEVREAEFRHIGSGFEDRGQLDGLLSSGNRYTIVENKLFARFSGMDQEKLEFDDQVTSYVAGLSRGEVEGYEDSIDVGLIDVLYNVTLKPALRKKKGRGSTPPETDKEFTNRCVQDIIANPDRYHLQFKTSRSQEAVDEFIERRKKHVADLMYEEKMDVWERNPSACFEYGQCPFLKICRSPHDDIPDGYMRREERK